MQINITKTCIYKKLASVSISNYPNLISISDNQEKVKTAWTKKKAYFQKYQFREKIKLLKRNFRRKDIEI